MHFDKKTLTSWQDTQISEITCTLIEKGCAGEKISVSRGREKDTLFLGEEDGISYFAKADEVDFFRDITITGVVNKWIVKSSQIANHCGCGSSFSRKTGNPIIDRARALKLQMKQKKEGIH